MSRLGMKNVIARSIVDRDFRRTAFGRGADLAGAIQQAGYDVTPDEVRMLSCNSEASFDERLVTIDNMMEYWARSESRIMSLTSGVAAGAAPDPGTPAG
jgi:hypothetical protein